MERETLRKKELGKSVKPRLKKTCSTVTGLVPKVSLPKLCTPRVNFDLHNSRKLSIGGITSRFSHLEPLPPLQMKNKNTDRFGQSPIMAVESDDDYYDKEIYAFIRQIERRRTFVRETEKS